MIWFTCPLDGESAAPAAIDSWWPNRLRGDDDEVPAGFDPENPTTFVCEYTDCQFHCPTINGLHWHYFEKHGDKHSIRYKVDQNPVCAC